MTTHHTHHPLRMVNGTMPALGERALHIPVVGFLEYCLRGIGQVEATLGQLGELLT
jgi:hypothetical protein